MKFVIVTGMSGAGKSTALKMLEDMGYFCVDNLPIALLPKFAELAHAPGSDISQVAVGVDIRNGRSLDEMSSVLEHLKASGVAYQILYLEASDEVLVKRYKETRRTHPLAKQGRVEDGIRQEREKLLYLKENATYILDTSQLYNRTGGAACDHTSTFRSLFQKNFCAAEFSDEIMRNTIILVYGNLDHVLNCIFFTLADCFGNFCSLAHAGTHMSIAVTNNYKCGKTHCTSAFNGLGYTFNRNYFICQL